MIAGLGGGHKLVIKRNMKQFDKNAFLGDIVVLRFILPYMYCCCCCCCTKGLAYMLLEIGHTFL